MVLQANMKQLETTWGRYRPMWPQYWLKLMAIRAGGGWRVQILRLTGRFSEQDPVHPSTVQSGSFFVTSRAITPDLFEQLIMSLRDGSEVLLPGLPGPITIPSSEHPQCTYAEWDYLHDYHPMQDVTEGSRFAVAELTWHGDMLEGLLKELDPSLHAEAVRIGYDSFTELAKAQVRYEWNQTSRPEISVTLPMAFRLDSSDVDAGKVRVYLREPLDAGHVRVFLLEDNRWSDDLAPLKIYHDKPVDGWQRLRIDLRKVPIVEGSALWVKYMDGSPCIPRPLKLDVGHPPRYDLELVSRFIYGDSLPKALRNSGEKLETAVLNALAGLDVTTFYCGVKGAQVEGADIVAVDRERRQVAVLEVTAESYRKAIDDKRPVVSAAAQRLREALPFGWTVYAVLLMPVEASKVDAAHRELLRTANVVLLDRSDLEWLGTTEASAQEWWSRIALQSQTWLDQVYPRMSMT